MSTGAELNGIASADGAMNERPAPNKAAAAKVEIFIVWSFPYVSSLTCDTPVNTTWTT